MGNQMVQINLEQTERLKELGCYLQQFRQKQRISLETVALKTLIPVRLLSAIETGNVEQLPEPVYIQGFIRRYADAIGMDGMELANAFPAQTDLKVPRSSWRGTVQAQLRPLHLYLIYMALVIGAISGLSYLLNRSSTPQLPGLNTTAAPMSLNIAAGTPSPNGPAAQPDASSAIVSQSAPTTTAPQLSKKAVHVGLTLTSQSWIRVVVDGKTEFEGVLAEGTQREWEADKQVILRAGNAGGVRVSFNNADAKTLGEPGAVEEVTFGSSANLAPRAASASETLTASN